MLVRHSVGIFISDPLHEVKNSKDSKHLHDFGFARVFFILRQLLKFVTMILK